MARIPESEIERLKEEVSVERLAEGAGIVLVKSGKDRLGRCPFHQDDQPSLTLTPAKNLWHCFGCGAGGGPIDWVMKLQGVSFRHAVEILREGAAPLPASSLAADAVPAASPGARAVKRSTVPKLAAPVAFDADDQALLDQVTDYYAETLKQSPEAQAYLKARGLDHVEAIERFKLGYANRTLGLRLPEKNRVAGELIRTRLQRLGLYRESGHEHFNGSLIVPVLDPTGHVSGLYGRKIRDDLRAGTPKHLYLPGPHRGVWNVEALAASREIILCEALLDALTFWCAGYRNVAASYGIEGFTDQMLDAFKAHGTERVLIAYDRDAPGERAAEKLAGRLMTEGIECFRIQFPKDMDANAYALKVTPAAKSLGLVIRKAVWLGKGAPKSAVTSAAALVTAPAAVPAVAPTVAPASPAARPAAAEVPVVEIPAAPVVASVVVPTAAAAAPLPASPMPAPARDIPVEVGDKDLTLTLGDGEAARRYRVRGLAKNLAVDVLKVNLMVSVGGGAGDGGGDPGAGAGSSALFHVDTLDLYSARQRAHYGAEAARETGLDERLLKADLGRVLLALEGVQDQTIARALALEPQPGMDEAERAAALALLKSPDLIERILTDFAACGIVGEATNKLVGYLAAVSRKLDHPLAVVIQSSSAAGKSSLMDAILALMPEEERIKYSAMTGQSLFYMGETNLQHKILAIVEEEGASRASYALKLLQSEGELTIASTGKDPATGNLVTQQYKVMGPVMIFLTTTAIEIDEELLNRCLVLSVDEDREQTRAIHRLQRTKRTLAGLEARQEKARLLNLHQNAQRLLRTLAVVNPYADQLTFLDDRTRTRRDHEKYLTLIDAIALLHQHQRPVRTMAGGAGAGHAAIEYIEVIPADIARANALAHEVLGTSLDELPPQTRRLLAVLHGLVAERMAAARIARRDVRFSRADVRRASGLSDTQARIHLERLTALEYLLIHRGMRGQSYEYELLHDGALEVLGAHLSGLIDAGALQAARASGPTSESTSGPTSESTSGLTSESTSAPPSATARATTTASSREQVGGLAGSSRPHHGPNAAPSRTEAPAGEAQPPTVSDDSPSVPRKTRIHGGNGQTRLYPQPAALPATSTLPAFPLAAGA